jgi:predicted nucleic acid-binding protein
MKHLLDVNVLLASIWEHHPQHQTAFDWLDGKVDVLCPIAELGFRRISTNKQAFNATMDKARELLAVFSSERKAARIPDDLPALDSRPSKSEHVTDCYLADLAAKHGLKPATLDEGIKHPAAVLVKPLKPSSEARD